MPLVPMKEILRESIAQKYAVGGFDAGEHGFAEAIIQAAEETQLPVILMIAEVFIKNLDTKNFFRYLRDRINNSEAPIDLHYDHGTSYETCMRAIDYGFSSVMIDGSALPYEENLALTKKVVKAAHSAGVSVEAELGHVGGPGGCDLEGSIVDETAYTNPEIAAEFVEKTAVDALAVAIGTVHGVYRGKPKLDLERLRKIRNSVSVPLVMHGGSGLSKEDFQNTIKYGINKINFFTDISIAAVNVIKNKLEETKGNVYYPELIDMSTRKAKEVVKDQIKLFGTKPLSK